MKKILKVVMSIIGGIIILIGVGGCITALQNGAALKQESKFCDQSYGQLVKISGGSICVDIEGEGKKVIVISPGFASTSPVLEMKGLIDELKKKYTVATIEPFGYGLSDQTNRQRTVENMTDEMHQVLEKLGYHKYILMGHSISGVYALYYTNQYPNEVEAYVGIDSAVPKQSLEDEGSSVQYHLLSWINKIGIYRVLAEHDQEGIVPKIKGYKYSELEEKVYKALVYKNLLNANVLEEYKQSKRNFNKVINLKFPKQIPVLYFLSSDNCESAIDWRAVHEAVITRQTKGQIEVLNGNHYLHYDNADKMAELFERWQAENKL